MNAAEPTLAQELAEVSRLVEDDDVASALQRFLERITRTVPGCDRAAVAVRERRVEFVAAHGPRAGEVTRLPSQDGPIAEALQFREPRYLADTRTDARWPGLGRRLAEAGCRSCLVLPLPRQRTPAAALVLYARQPQCFGDTAQDVALLLALHAGVVFDNAQLFHDSRRLIDQLNAALRTRQLIGQAQGLLMRQLNCDQERGFALLKGASQNTNTKLRDVASALVAAHDNGELPAMITKFGVDDAAP